MNIVLIGYRGTGKTAVGKLLAKKLNRKLVSTDKMVVSKANASIDEIVKKYSWAKFRNLESEAIKNIKDQDGCIIDTGGGIILKGQNIAALKKNSITFLLKADPKVIASRIKNSKQRPSLTYRSFIEEIKEISEQRKEKYNKAADFVIGTSNLNVEEVCNKIIKKLDIFRLG
ncbi:shikimate kinase [Candidatus Woesearchaeota archaeon]|nr:shikimate kinase [Candidatus Woesearchaeota archaeon]